MKGIKQKPQVEGKLRLLWIKNGQEKHWLGTTDGYELKDETGEKSSTE